MAPYHFHGQVRDSNLKFSASIIPVLTVFEVGVLPLLYFLKPHLQLEMLVEPYGYIYWYFTALSTSVNDICLLVDMNTDPSC
jgi:hypothetical protein